MGTHPENRLAGLEAALASGVDGVEVDLRATRDGRVVLLHDRSLARTHGISRDIEALDYGELLALTRMTQPVPPLEDALALAAGRVRLVLDVKQPSIARNLRKLLRLYRGQIEAWVWTHDPAIARECIDTLDPTIPVSLIVRPELVPLWSGSDGMRLARAGGLARLLFEHPGHGCRPGRAGGGSRAIAPLRQHERRGRFRARRRRGTGFNLQRCARALPGATRSSQAADGRGMKRYP